jgi:hypothetical protein
MKPRKPGLLKKKPEQGNEKKRESRFLPNYATMSGLKEQKRNGKGGKETIQ